MPRGIAKAPQGDKGGTEGDDRGEGGKGGVGLGVGWGHPPKTLKNHPASLPTTQFHIFQYPAIAMGFQPAPPPIHPLPHTLTPLTHCPHPFCPIGGVIRRWMGHKLLWAQGHKLFGLMGTPDHHSKIAVDMCTNSSLCHPMGAQGHC